jgi:hypothetical protein
MFKDGDFIQGEDGNVYVVGDIKDGLVTLLGADIKVIEVKDLVKYKLFSE